MAEAECQAVCLRVTWDEGIRESEQVCRCYCPATLARHAHLQQKRSSFCVLSKVLLFKKIFTKYDLPLNDLCLNLDIRFLLQE